MGMDEKVMVGRAVVPPLKPSRSRGRHPLVVIGSSLVDFRDWAISLLFVSVENP